MDNLSEDAESDLEWLMDLLDMTREEVLEKLIREFADNLENKMAE